MKEKKKKCLKTCHVKDKKNLTKKNLKESEGRA